MGFKLSIAKEDLKKYDYKTAKIKGFKTLSQLGLESNYLGGRIHRIVELKDKDVLLAVDHLNNVIGVMTPEKKVEAKKEVVCENNVCEVVNEEPSNVVVCEACKKEFKSNTALSVHKRFCKGE